MLKLIKLFVVTVSLGSVMGAGAFEVHRYANHRDTELYRFFAADSTTPRYRTPSGTYSSATVNYSYSASQTSYSGYSSK